MHQETSASGLKLIFRLSNHAAKSEFARGTGPDCWWMFIETGVQADAVSDIALQLLHLLAT
eukprot:1140320-Pelagomonas_calceolata.AAC.5